MAVVFYLFFISFGSVLVIAYLKKRGLSVSWAWAHPSVLLPRLASPVTQFGLLAAFYGLLRSGHTAPGSALMACLLLVGVCGTVSLAVRSAVRLAAVVSARLAVKPAVVAEEPYVVVEHPDSARFRERQSA